MPQSEFDIIENYFYRQKVKRGDVNLGIGDDAAIITIPNDKQLVVALDTLVAGVHFPENTSAGDIAYKALAVNLSDLAAMGAEPAWFTLALTMPEITEDWLTDFAQGLFSLAEQYNIQLVGGDTTHGPLTISIQVAGYVLHDRAMRRDGARDGDLIYVTGKLGDAALGLRCLQQPDKYPNDQAAITQLNRPQPKVELGLALGELASACIDVSDGLLADLQHILEASGVGASVDRQAIPLSTGLQVLCDTNEANYALALAGGDDYELCFCAAADKQDEVSSIASELDISITCIGVIEQEKGIRLHHANMPCTIVKGQGYDHFLDQS